MIRCSDTRGSQLTFSLIQCWLEISHIMGTLAYKFMRTGTRGVSISYEDKRRSTPFAFFALFA